MDALEAEPGRQQSTVLLWVNDFTGLGDVLLVPPGTPVGRLTGLVKADNNLARIHYSASETTQQDLPVMSAMRARKQNRAWPEGPEEDITALQFRGSKIDRPLSSQLNPSAVLPTSLVAVSREAYEPTGLA